MPSDPLADATGGRSLTHAELNRATLARQLLLDRASVSVRDAVAALAGLNAQNADDPYIGLWARLEHFDVQQLHDALHEASIVRSCLMRYTQHLVTSFDYVSWWSILRPVLQRVQRSAFGKRTDGVDLEHLVELGIQIMRDGTLTRPQLGKRLAETWPGYEPQALAWSFQYLHPVVHPPPAGLWGRRGGHTPFALADDWIGQPPRERADPAELVRRYLAAFGPASVRDAQAWSGLTKLASVFETLRPELVTFAGPGDRELFDLPAAPRPPADTRAPVRYLPPFDNVVLAYADRSRMMSPTIQARVCVGAAVAATLLVDGTVHGTWRVTRHDGIATLEVELFRPLPAPERTRARDEGHRLLAFVAPDAARHRWELRRADHRA